MFICLIVGALVPAAVASGADFTNNLFSDLAPYVFLGLRASHTDG